MSHSSRRNTEELHQNLVICLFALLNKRTNSSWKNSRTNLSWLTDLMSLARKVPLLVVSHHKIQVLSEFSMSKYSLFFPPQYYSIVQCFSFADNVSQGSAVAFQAYLRTRYIGCSSTYCTPTSGPGLYMNFYDWQTNPVTGFQIYRKNGKGDIRVGSRSNLLS